MEIKILAPVIWAVILVSVFIGTYIMNRNTPKPEGCEELINEISCRGCRQLSCGHHPTKKIV